MPARTKRFSQARPSIQSEAYLAKLFRPCFSNGLNMVHPADRKRVLAAFTRCKDNGTPFEIEYRIIHKDGSVRYVIDEDYPVFNDKDRITEIEGIITDITELKNEAACQ